MPKLDIRILLMAAFDRLAALLGTLPLFKVTVIEAVVSDSGPPVPESAFPKRQPLIPDAVWQCLASMRREKGQEEALETPLLYIY